MSGLRGPKVSGILIRGVGGLILIMSLFPVFRGLDTKGDAFRVASVEIAETTIELAWWGSISVLLLALLLTVLLSDWAIRFGRLAAKWVCSPGLMTFSVGIGLLAFLLSWAVVEFLYQGLYTNMDEVASAIQARYMAHGHLAGPRLEFPEGWLVTNTLMVEKGWVSQYPPSHLVVMALFFRLGIPFFVGPVLMGLMAWLLALSFHRLLPGKEAVARMGGLLTAVSPFLLFLAGGSLSHLTAGAAGAAVLYASLRARDGKVSWGLLVGVAVGVMVCARPFIGMILGTVFPATLWVHAISEGRTKWALKRAGATVLGGLPFAILLGLYNQQLFGHPTQLGYLTAFGESHKLGFHVDPWGNFYGVGAALAFTSRDLLDLGVKFLETPLPLTLVLGVLLLLRPSISRGNTPLLAWAFLPLLANAFYWFHDPRMMFEAAPAWILLAVLGVVDFVSSTRDGEPWRQKLGQFVSWTVVLSLGMGVVWGAPTRWKTYSWTAETLARIQVPSVPTGDPSLVFVHSSWNERSSAKLHGTGGMRQDSIVSILRRNTNCLLQEYAEARTERAGGGDFSAPLPAVDLLQEAGSTGDLERASPYPGITIRTREGEILTPDCMRELEADRFGNVALAPLIWQGDLPGLEESGPLFVRDLGPERNERVRALFPHRPAFVFSPFSVGAPPEIASYDEAMRVLWGGEG